MLISLSIHLQIKPKRMLRPGSIGCLLGPLLGGALPCRKRTLSETKQSGEHWGFRICEKLREVRIVFLAVFAGVPEGSYCSTGSSKGASLISSVLFSWLAILPFTAVLTLNSSPTTVVYDKSLISRSKCSDSNDSFLQSHIYNIDDLE